MRIRRTLGAAAVATGLVFAGAVAPASAQPVGGCPTGEGAYWILAPVEAAIDFLDNGNFADQNGDGYGCFRVSKGFGDKSGWTWKDNTNKLLEEPPPPPI